MQPHTGYAGSQELVPWKWELHYQHAVWEDTHTNQNEMETGHSRGIELPLVSDSLDSLFSLKNCDITPILLLSIGRACINVAHPQSLEHQEDS